MKTIALLASGTGGHIYPALSVANEYISRGYKILWIFKHQLKPVLINMQFFQEEHQDQNFGGFSFFAFFYTCSPLASMVKNLVRFYPIQI